MQIGRKFRQGSRAVGAPQVLSGFGRDGNGEPPACTKVAPYHFQASGPSCRFQAIGGHSGAATVLVDAAYLFIWATVLVADTYLFILIGLF